MLEVGEGVGGFGGWGGGPVFGVVVLVVVVGGVESLADAGDLVVAVAVGFEAGPFEVERFVGVAQFQSLPDRLFGVVVAARPSRAESTRGQERPRPLAVTLGSNAARPVTPENSRFSEARPPRVDGTRVV